jgi:hypothetical protein
MVVVIQKKWKRIGAQPVAVLSSSERNVGVLLSFKIEI